MKFKKKTKDLSFDKRSITSAFNGLKGGRPAHLNNRLSVCVTKKDSKMAIEQGDTVLGLELALQRLLPNASVMVQSFDRLKKAGVNIFGKKTEYIFINGYQFSLPKEMENYFNHFLPLTKGTQDFKFILRVPKEATK